MKKIVHASMCTFVLFLCLALAACAVSQLAVSLNISALAVSAASTTIAGVSSMDSGVKVQIVTYLSAINVALTSAATDLKAGSITSAQIAVISATLSAAVIPVLPDSVPNDVKTSVTAVTTAVQLFLSLLSAQTTTVQAKTRSTSRTVRLNLSYKDQRLLNSSLDLLNRADIQLFPAR